MYHLIRNIPHEKEEMCSDGMGMALFQNFTSSPSNHICIVYYILSLHTKAFHQLRAWTGQDRPRLNQESML